MVKTMARGRYPGRGFAKAQSGEDVFKNLAKSATWIRLVTTEDAEVMVNDERLGSTHDPYESHFVFETGSMIQTPSGIRGGIKSVVIESEAEYFIEWSVSGDIRL